MFSSIRGNVVCIPVTVFFFKCLSVAAAPGQLRIIGGRDVHEDDLIYVVRLELRLNDISKHESTYYHRCTCSALTERWTLAARHCVDDNYFIKGTDNFRRLQMKKMFKSPEIRNSGSLFQNVIRYRWATNMSTPLFSLVIDEILPPITRTHVMTSDDICLLKTEPIKLPEYGRLSALDFDTLLYQEVIVAGYGMTNYTLPNFSQPHLTDTLVLKKPLQVVKGMLVKCVDKMPYPYLCVNQACRRPGAICEGDSGGPVVHDSGIVAVTSRSDDSNCQMISDRFRSPEIDVVVPVSPYLNWIYDVVSIDSK